MNRYALCFHADGRIVWLKETDFVSAFTFVEKNYGSGWRDLCKIYSCQEIAA